MPRASSGVRRDRGLTIREDGKPLNAAGRSRSNTEGDGPVVMEVEMKRRELLRGLLMAPWVIFIPRRGIAGAASAGAVNVETLRKNWRQLLAAGADIAPSAAPLKHSDAEWKKILTPAQYNVLREAGTELPGSSPLNEEKHPGVFVCAGCRLPLFTSAMKFDSGTGWPSFFTTIPGAVATRRDYSLIIPRTEYHCVRCGGHQGHVFDDGPPPTNQRWCNNGVALRFIPKTRAA
jgi:peptide-methionine (R)-S-oxide reductase